MKLNSILAAFQNLEKHVSSEAVHFQERSSQSLSVLESLASQEQLLLEPHLVAHFTEVLDGTVDFAATKFFGGSKQKVKNCTKGWACGYTCLSRKVKNCKKTLEGQYKTLAEYLEKTEKPKPKKPKASQKKASTKGAFPPPEASAASKKAKNVKLASLEDIEKHLNVDEATARRYYLGINKFTGMDYKQMREADRGKNFYFVEGFAPIPISEDVKKATKDADEFLMKAPTYEGTIYRGIKIGDDQQRATVLAALNSEDGFEQDAMSSYSSSPKIAKQFATDWSKNKGMVIVVKENRSGADISEMSKYPGEKEVLVPKGTTYKQVGKEYVKDGIMYVEVEEVRSRKWKKN